MGVGENIGTIAFMTYLRIIKRKKIKLNYHHGKKKKKPQTHDLRHNKNMITLSHHFVETIYASQLTYINTINNLLILIVPKPRLQTNYTKKKINVLKSGIVRGKKVHILFKSSKLETNTDISPHSNKTQVVLLKGSNPLIY